MNIDKVIFRLYYLVIFFIIAVMVLCIIHDCRGNTPKLTSVEPLWYSGLLGKSILICCAMIILTSVSGVIVIAINSSRK